MNYENSNNKDITINCTNELSNASPNVNINLNQ